MQAIACAAYGFEQFDIIGIVDLAPQTTDIHIDHIRRDHMVITPQVGFGLFARDDIDAALRLTTTDPGIAVIDWASAKVSALFMETTCDSYAVATCTVSIIVGV